MSLNDTLSTGVSNEVRELLLIVKLKGLCRE